MTGQKRKMNLADAEAHCVVCRAENAEHIEFSPGSYLHYSEDLGNFALLYVQKVFPESRVLWKKNTPRDKWAAVNWVINGQPRFKGQVTRDLAEAGMENHVAQNEHTNKFTRRSVWGGFIDRPDGSVDIRLVLSYPPQEQPTHKRASDDVEFVQRGTKTRQVERDRVPVMP